MAKKTIKCPTCGSSKLKKINDNILECEYCLTKIENQDFKIDFSKKQKNKNFFNGCNLIEVNVSEQEFYERAISLLALNKNTPLNLLEKSKFEPVKSEYFFYGVVDVDFSLKKVENQLENSRISPKEKICGKIAKSIYFSINNADKRFHNEIINYDNLHYYNYFEEYFEEIVEINGVTTKKTTEKSSQNLKNILNNEIEKCQNDCIEDFKKELLSTNKDANLIDHKITRMKLYALPVYSLKFVYQNKEYTLLSSASNLKIIGNFPRHKNLICYTASKNTKPFFITSITISSLMILFAIVLCFLKNHLLLKYELFIFLAGAVYLTSEIAYKINLKKQSIKLFDIKMNKLKKFLKENNIQFTKQSEKYIENYLRWK